jgi:hypothetical protein
VSKFVYCHFVECDIRELQGEASGSRIQYPLFIRIEADSAFAGEEEVLSAICRNARSSGFAKCAVFAIHGFEEYPDVCVIGVCRVAEINIDNRVPAIESALNFTAVFFVTRVVPGYDWPRPADAKSCKVGHYPLIVPIRKLK